MKLNPEVYRDAAKYVSANVTGCCGAIISTTEKKQTKGYMSEFEYLFYEPNESFHISPWPVNGYWWYPPSMGEHQLARSLALLLMAEIVEGEL